MVNYIETNGKATVEVNVEVTILKEGDYLVAYCPALALSSYGDTEQEAKYAFEGAMETFLEESHKRGTLEKILLDLGWALKKHPSPSYKPPASDRNPLVINRFKEKVAIPM